MTGKEIHSGFATKLLLELVLSNDTQQKHLTILLFNMTPERFKDGYDASSISVSDLLKRKSVNSTKLFQRLFELGMRATELDITIAVQVMPEHYTNVLNLLLDECLKTRKTTFTSACQEAIKLKKFPFVICLINRGGIPDSNDLMKACGWPKKSVDPVIAQYLKRNTRLMEVDEYGERIDFVNPFGIDRKSSCRERV